MKIEVSDGELIDKHSILEIKLLKIANPEKLKNIKKELEILTLGVDAIYKKVSTKHKELKLLHDQLIRINQQLWDIEDAIRECESKQNFDETFISLARSVYQNNDKRSEIKKQINLLSNSKLIEEKSYEPYP